MKVKFLDVGFSKARMALLERVNEILEDYREQGYKLTLRQAYYQLVAQGIIPNNDKEYSKLSALLTDGRMAGIVDWGAIEDRVRTPKNVYWVIDIPDALSDTVKHYRLQRMRGQKTYIEVWVEKDALSNIFSRVTEKYGINLMINRGYSSASAMYAAAERFKFREKHYGQNLLILYFGDHDPSGLDMIRDIQNRMDTFGANVGVKQIALNMDQIKQYAPPPNPAKISDPRAAWYINIFGDESWELDSLEPSVLVQLCEDAVLEEIDLDMYNETLEQEQRDIETLKKFIDNAK